MVDFVSEEMKKLEAEAFLGEQASIIKNDASWAWIKSNIMDKIFEEAIKCMRIAKTEDQRSRAQAMLIAHDEVISRFDYLINQGNASRASLAELVTQQNAELEQERKEANG